MLDYLWRIPELPNSDMLLQVHDIYSSVKSLQCNLMFKTSKKKLRPENNSSLIPESMILTSCCASLETTQEKQPCGYF
jgi:hypothetical protein